jgi:UDP-N-acetyl-D-glucosamine dehydrogenase
MQQYRAPREKTVTVVGLGYVGLPVALLAQERGWQVLGLDVDEEKVQKINRQQSPLNDEQISHDLKRYPITATTDPAKAAGSRVMVIAVPTPVTKNNAPDFKPLKSAITTLLPHLTAGQVLIIESTINPGVMDEIIIPLLRTRKDLQLEHDSATAEPLYLAHCPERVNPADKKWTVRNIPRVLGGYSPEGIARAVQFYNSILEVPVKVMKSVTEAEAAKILENTFRDVNIAFVNEMAKSFAKLDIDILNVIEGASTKPFGFLAHYPGNGVGGHCIGVDPYYMIERAKKAGFDHKFLKLAREINDSMPGYTVELLREGLQTLHKRLADATIAVLGLAYKKNVADIRESPALKTVQILKKHAAAVQIYDPYIPERSTVATVAEALQGSDAVVLACDHTVLVEALTPEKLTKAGIRVVIDGKNALDADGIAAAHIPYFGIGRARKPR